MTAPLRLVTATLRIAKVPSVGDRTVPLTHTTMTRRASIVNHRHLEDRIILYIDGELPSEERVQCEAHLRTCPRCRERVDALREAWHSDSLLHVTGPTLRLRTRFEAALLGEDSIEPGPTVGTRIALLVRPALMAVSMAAGIVIGAYLGSGPDGEAAQVEPIPSETGILAFSFADDLQEISAESVELDYLLPDLDEIGD